MKSLVDKVKDGAVSVVSGIKDNTKHKICFNTIILSDIKEGKFEFIILITNFPLVKTF